MPIPRGASKETIFKRTLGEYKKDELNVGQSKHKVQSRRQAIAIALDEARRRGHSIPRKK